jgi:ankyrin repeat protein
LVFIRNSSHLHFHLVVQIVLALDQKLCCITIYALVIAGGNVDITDSKGYTVLHRVIMIKGRSNSSIIFIKCLLIAAATDCNAPTRDGKTALHLHAIYGGGGAAASSEDVVDIFYNLRHIFGTGHTNGIESRFGDGSLVSALIHAGAAVNLIDLEGATPLYYAAGAGNLSIVEALLRRNAEPNLTDKNLVFPLHIALKCHYKEVFETLLLAGANVNAFNAEGCNPLHLAVTMKGGNDFINILIRHNCDVDLRNREGATGLHLAATRGNSANIDVLLDANANANIQDHNGMTPLHYSISTHYSAAMASLESLFRTGFDMHITDRHEMTALHRALVIKADLNIIYRLIRRDPTQVNFD